VAGEDVIEEGRPRLRGKARMRYDRVRRSFVLLLPERAVLLSDSAAEILQLCDGSRTAAGVVSVLQDKYHDAGIPADVQEFLQQAAHKGWIEWIAPA
jgi:pyrroloquinoline quinone biosynthesis protein D